MSGHADTIRTILAFYRSDATDRPGDTATMLQLRQAELGVEALDALEAELVEQADRIAWLEGEVAGWRIKLAECEAEIEHLRDRAVCSGCGGDVAESGACIRECGGGEMIPASDLPTALRAMRESRDEWAQEAMESY